MSTVPTISTLPPAPQRTQTPEAFATTADTFVASLATLVSETNTTIGAINNALAGALVTFNAYQGDWSAGTYASGDVVRKSDVFYISLTGSNTQEPPDTNWQALNIASSIDYDNSTSGLTATDVQAAIDEITNASSIDYDNSTSGLTATDVQNALDEVYSKYNILGTVSESSGTPTGAIIERGSNANGEFVKYADGTMICTRKLSFDFTSSGYVNYSTPAIFVGNEPSASISFQATSSATRHSLYQGTCVMTNTSEWYVANTSTIAESLFIYLLAVGRWF